jgi:hypothetical protein
VDTTYKLCSVRSNVPPPPMGLLKKYIPITIQYMMDRPLLENIHERPKLPDPFNKPLVDFTKKLF